MSLKIHGSWHMETLTWPIWHNALGNHDLSTSHVWYYRVDLLYPNCGKTIYICMHIFSEIVTLKYITKIKKKFQNLFFKIYL